MTYNEFKEIINHVKKTVPCTQCDKKFTDEGIKILSQLNDEILFHFTCDTCSNQLLINVTITDQDQNHSRLKINTSSAPEISHNDVLDIHNFLNRFNGDFRKLFSITKK